ncbi:MAG: sulfatase-like hydrolase/transferase [Saprospiraceae bacterium]|nr:sulfatase-like hydrolase/transferase [Saprospiraceae bacterium]
MNRYFTNNRIILFVFCALGCSISCHQPEDSQPPNILLIMTDQQPVSCVGAYGNDKIKTPNLDVLAAEGHLFRNFYIATFPCSPSRASILTGRYLHHHNVFTNNVMLDHKIPTMGNMLSEGGYHTGYFGKAHLGGSMYVGRSGGDGIDYLHPPGSPSDPVGNQIGPYWHHDRMVSDSGWITKKQDGGPGEDQSQLGFQLWKGGWKDYKNWLIDQGQDSFAMWAGNHDDLQSAPEGEHMYSLLGEAYHMANYFTGQTSEFIKQQNKDEPWAAVLSFFGPHLPVAPPPPWDTLFALEEITLPANFEDDLRTKPHRQKEISSSYFNGVWSRDQFKDYIRRYWGYCGYIDEQIGRIIRQLKDSGQYDNTLIIFTSDHGDMLTGHGMIFKLGSNGYEELFKVPAIIKLPGYGSGNQQHDQLVSSIDLLPTILETAGIPIPDSIDGQSMLPILNGSKQTFRKFIFSEIHSSNADGKTIICRDDHYKYVYHWLSNDVDEFYDLVTDPGELNNLYTQAAYSDQISRMQEAIIKWAQETNHHYATLIAQKASK